MPTLTGHLEYYTKHRINPVRYDTNNLKLHYDRRASLYRSLGVTPLTIRGARVLEVAPGTGQNSLFIAKHCPESLTLVEPNPVARRDIADVYSTTGNAVIPEVVACKFEEFEPNSRYDLVVCENWLGDSAHERTLLRKLGGLVADGGLLIVTAVSPVGVLPNLLRRALSNLLAPSGLPFEERTVELCRAFAPHLRTIEGMTRNVTDWVHDNMLNPAYLGIILTVPMMLTELADSFDVLGSSPRFGADWRWFKGLCGPNRDFNRHILAEYHRTLHNFLDYRTLLPDRDLNRNVALENAALSVAETIRDWEAGLAQQEAVEDTVRDLQAGISDLPQIYSLALDEFLDSFAEPGLTAEAVAALPRLGSMFGRETLYLSFEKRS